MSFFDKKEDVIDLELTQYGKYLLSEGKLKPYYYAFFDDDVIYDGNYAGMTEEQNAIKDRIEETIRTRTQYVFEGIETTINHNNKLIRGEAPNQQRDINLFSDEVQTTQTKHYALSLPIGNSDFNTEKVPAWSVNYLKGEISSSHIHIGHPKTNLYDEDMYMMKIPQIETKIKYKTAITDELSSHAGVNSIQENPSTYPDKEGHFTEDVFEDGTSFTIEEDYIIVQLQEDNAPYLYHNFDIEVFEMTSSKDPVGNVKQILTPLYFEKERKTNIVNNILIDEPYDALNEQHILEQNPLTDSTFVEHFFHVYVDQEIDPETMCNLVDVKKHINAKLLDDYQCPDIYKKKTEFTMKPVNVYETPGGLLEDEVEDCD